MATGVNGGGKQRPRKDKDAQKKKKPVKIRKLKEVVWDDDSRKCVASSPSLRPPLPSPGWDPVGWLLIACVVWRGVREFLTGFSKRKKQREAAARNKAIERERQEHLENRAQVSEDGRSTTQPGGLRDRRRVA